MIKYKSDFRLKRGTRDANGRRAGNLERRGRKGIIWARFTHDRKEHRFSTGETQEAKAREIAWARFLEVRGDMPANSAPRQRASSPKLRVLVDRYRYHIREHATGIRETTIRRNVSSLRRIIAIATGSLTPFEYRLSEITPEIRTAWIAHKRQEAKATPDDWAFNARLNALWAQAVSVFSKAARIQLYHDIVFPPEFERFLQAKRLREPMRAWTPIDPETVTVMDREFLVGPIYGTPACVIFQLARYFGLRSGEIQAIRRHWFTLVGMDTYHLDIRVRRAAEDRGGVDYRPKARDGVVSVGTDVAHQWFEWCGDPGPTDLLIPENKWKETKDEVLTVLRKHIDRRLPLHELRKLAGSEVLTRTGSITKAAAFLRDSVSVTEQHYATLLDGVRGHEMPQVPTKPSD